MTTSNAPVGRAFVNILFCFRGLKGWSLSTGKEFGQELVQPELYPVINPPEGTDTPTRENCKSSSSSRRRLGSPGVGGGRGSCQSTPHGFSAAIPSYFVILCFHLLSCPWPLNFHLWVLWTLAPPWHPKKSHRYASSRLPATLTPMLQSFSHLEGLNFPAKVSCILKACAPLN